MTDGGLGCALLWPFDLTRYFAPWRPIPVAPVGLAFFSSYGGMIAVTELVLFSPALLFALRSGRVRAKPAAGLFLALWFMSVWLVSSGDPVRDGIVGFVLREDTSYAGGFSEEACASRLDAERLLGPPGASCWRYSWSPRDAHFYRMRVVCFLNARVETVIRRWH